MLYSVRVHSLFPFHIDHLDDQLSGGNSDNAWSCRLYAQLESALVEVKHRNHHSWASSLTVCKCLFLLL